MSKNSCIKVYSSLLATRQNEMRGERPLPTFDELFDEAANQIKFLVESSPFSKQVSFNV